MDPIYIEIEPFRYGPMYMPAGMLIAFLVAEVEPYR